MMDVRGFHDLLDGVDLVRGGDRDGARDRHLVGGSHVLVDDNLTGHCAGNRHRNVHLQPSH